MKTKPIVYLLAALVFLSACSSSVTVETKEEFKQVELPDSSVVYLNHNSKLTYDKNFNPRRVKLEGEAFFSVNDGNTPFVIETKEGEEATVLGTEFNMIASFSGAIIEVEIGIVSFRIGSLNIYREIGRGRRLDFGRHDNGLHLGQAKHHHRNWIGLMDKDFRKNGRILKRSTKHMFKSPGKSKQMFKSNPKSKSNKVKPGNGGGGKSSKQVQPKGEGKASKSGGGGKKAGGKGK
jgi:hypothetical protein